MFNIIIITHGEFGKYLLETSFMIFGKQKFIQSISLNYNESVENLNLKIKKCIKKNNLNEILFLVDLYGGTPFNQVNYLIKKKNNFFVITGVNLPMLIEIYSLRLNNKKIYEIYNEIILKTQKSIICKKSKVIKKDKKNILNNKKEEKNEYGKYVLVRVDSRLLHGQITTSWNKLLNPKRIIIVSNIVYKDIFRKKIIEQSAPFNVKVNVITIEKMVEIEKKFDLDKMKIMLLFENLKELLLSIKLGLNIIKVNIGSISHSKEKIMVSRAVSLGNDEIKSFEEIKKRKIEIDIRKVPNDFSENINSFIEYAKKKLKK